VTLGVAEDSDPVDVSPFHITCPAPVPVSRRRRATGDSCDTFVEGATVYVSNNGVTYSDGVTYIELDSTCQEFNAADNTVSLTVRIRIECIKENV
jgi:hypothetical protein